MMTNPKQNRAHCFAVAGLVVVLAVVVLPGDWNVKAQDVTDEITPAKATSAEPPESNQEPGEKAVASQPIPKSNNARIELRKYDYSKNLKKSEKIGHGNEELFKQNIELTLRSQMKGWGDAKQLDPAPTMAWIGSELHLYGTARQHSVAELHVKKRFFTESPQISIETRFFEVDHHAVKDIFWAIGMRWYAIPGAGAKDEPAQPEQIAVASVPAIARNPFSQWMASSSQTSTSSVPLLLSFLDFNEMKAVVGMTKERTAGKILFAPKITLFDSQQATIQSADMHPFATSVSWNESDGAQSGIEVVREGMLLNVLPTLLDRDVVGIRFACEQSNIPSVTELSLPTKRQDALLESPNVLTKRFATDMTMRIGETAMLGWLEKPSGEDSTVRLVAITPRVIDYAGKFAEPSKEWTLPSDDESVAMKRGLVPLKHFPGPEAFAAKIQSERMNEAVAVPLPEQARKQLANLGVQLSVESLTEFRVVDSTFYIKADPARISFPGVEIPVIGGKGLTIETNRVSLDFSNGDLLLSFSEGVEIDAAETKFSASDEGSLKIEFPRPNTAGEGNFILSLTGDVQCVADEDMMLAADSLELNAMGWRLEGNAMMKASMGDGEAKTVHGHRIKMSSDFPAFIIEQQSSPLNAAALPSGSGKQTLEVTR